MNFTKLNIQIYGRINDPELYFIQDQIKRLESIDSQFRINMNNLVTLEIVPLLYDLFNQLQKDLKRTNIELKSKFTERPLIIINNKEYIQDFMKLLDMFQAQLGLTIFKEDLENLDKKSYRKYENIAIDTVKKKLLERDVIYVFLELEITDEDGKLLPKEKVLIELKHLLAPKTCLNFFNICKGNMVNAQGQSLSYKNTTFHRIIKDLCLQGGDINGEGGESIYGKVFEDETRMLKHNRPGIVGMANNGAKHTNGSSFYITVRTMPEWDSKYVAFGQVILGMRTLRKINKLQDGQAMMPSLKVEITNSGQYFYNKNDFFPKDAINKCELVGIMLSEVETTKKKKKVIKTHIKLNHTMYDFSRYKEQANFDMTPFCSPRSRQLTISKSIYKSYLDGGAKDKQLTQDHNNLVGQFVFYHKGDLLNKIKEIRTVDPNFVDPNANIQKKSTQVYVDDDEEYEEEDQGPRDPLLADKKVPSIVKPYYMDNYLNQISSIKMSHPDNIMAGAFDFNFFESLNYNQKLRLIACCKSGIDNPDSQMGCYAYNPTDYDEFGPFFGPALERYHQVDLGFQEHYNDWNLTGVEGLPADGVLDLTKLGLPALSMRVRTGRNLSRFPLPGNMSKEDRCNMENELEEAVFKTLINIEGFGGRYVSITPNRKGKISDEEYNQLVKDHIMFKDMSQDSFLKSAGIASDWPYGRGCYISEDKEFLIWVGEEDHLRIMCMKKGTILNEVFQRLEKAVKVTEEQIQGGCAKSEIFGVVTSCPTNIGTGMRASVHIQLPNLTKDGTETKAKAIAKPLGLSVRGLGGEHTPIGKDGTVDISPSARFCISEAEIVTALYKGIQLLKAEEDKAK